MSLSRASPTLSDNDDDSADIALYEILGVNKLCLDEDDSDESTKDSDCDTFSSMAPPVNCHRLHTPHDPILLKSSPFLLSSSECQYIINLGYQVSNNGGITFGPKYITEAALLDGVQVKLDNPNHHKVCVFTNQLVLLWIHKAFQRSHLDAAIRNWGRSNGYLLDGDDYSINPRLRLLRYDAIDQDIFLPHYDATTTIDEKESKITILLYLNSGGIQFRGGNTLFLNALEPSKDVLSISPECGKFVLFNHELYHASQALDIIEELVLQDKMVGGTKFVLRSDILFRRTLSSQNQERNTDHGGNNFSMLYNHIADGINTTNVNDVVSTLVQQDNSKEVVSLIETLKQLDLYRISVRTFLVPGRDIVYAMLIDLGLHPPIVEELCDQCQKATQEMKEA